MDEKEMISENLRDLLKEKEFVDVLKSGLDSIKPSKIRILIILLILVTISPSISNIVNSNETIKKLEEIIQFSDDIAKNMFGIIFTGYALFQALIGLNALKRMLISKIGKSSSFKTYNLYFFTLSILYLFIILINYILIIVIKNYNFKGISENFKVITTYSFLNIYIGINIFAISEIKSFLVNMYHCFNMSIFSEGVEILKELNDTKNDDV